MENQPPHLNVFPCFWAVKLVMTKEINNAPKPVDIWFCESVCILSLVTFDLRLQRIMANLSSLPLEAKSEKKNLCYIWLYLFSFSSTVSADTLHRETQQHRVRLPIQWSVCLSLLVKGSMRVFITSCIEPLPDLNTTPWCVRKARHSSKLYAFKFSVWEWGILLYS